MFALEWLPLKSLACLLSGQIRSDVTAVRGECLEADVLGNVSHEVAVDEDVFDGVHNFSPGINRWWSYAHHHLSVRRNAISAIARLSSRSGSTSLTLTACGFPSPGSRSIQKPNLEVDRLAKGLHYDFIRRDDDHGHEMECLNTQCSRQIKPQFYFQKFFTFSKLSSVKHVIFYFLHNMPDKGPCSKLGSSPCHPKPRGFASRADSRSLVFSCPKEVEDYRARAVAMKRRDFIAGLALFGAAASRGRL